MDEDRAHSNITQGLEIFREIMYLKAIGTGDGNSLPAVEFRERNGKGEFKK